MNGRVVVFAAAAIAAAGLATAFFLTHERVEVDTYRPPEGEARTNPMLAAQRLLQDLGYSVNAEVEFAPRFKLPGQFDTAVISFDYHSMQREDMDLLLDWIHDGGHLVVEIRPLYGRAFDPIFNPLDVEVSQPSYEFESLADVPGIDDTDEGTDEESASDQPPPFERFEGRDYWGDMTLNNERHIVFGGDEPLWTVADEKGVFAGQVAYGTGAITAVTDLAFARNRFIGQKDHAYIFTRLLGEPSGSGRIWLYYGQLFPSLWSLIWARADFLIKAGALVLLLALWRASSPFGPLIPAPAQGRKSFLEHVSASGRFLWRKQAHGVLLAKTQRAFLRDFERRHPAGRHTTDERRRELIADICDMPGEKVDNALRQLRSRSHPEFTHKMQLLRALWTKL